MGRRISVSYLFKVLGLIIVIAMGGSTVFAALPSTNNYQLNSYGFGSGGTSNSSTSSYALEGLSGEATSQTDSTSSYQLKPGFIETQQANVPKVTLTNQSNNYDKLHFVIDTQSNPSDALYALQVCAGSDFPCGSPLYVKADNTLGSALTTADYQLYSAWGGASGANMIGLSGATTYYIRAKATQGKFTESAYGPSASASTSSQQISFCLYTISCGSGSTVTFSLVASSVASGSNNIGVNFSTNANNGGSVYIYSAHGGLVSTSHPSFPINSATADLSSGSTAKGYGARVSSAASLTPVTPYGSPVNQVGALGTTVSTILDTTVPVSGATASIQLQAKASDTTIAASDYSDTITVIAAARF